MKKIINYVPTGTLPSRENSLAPLQPAEIIEDVHEAYELGITLTHIHARDKKDRNSYSGVIYEKIISGIKKYCPGLAICVSLSGRFFQEFEKRTEVLELYPDMGSLTMSSLNFPQSASINSPEMILKILQKMEDYGVNPEIECFDAGMINYTKFLINKNIIRKPVYINVIFGNLFNAQADISTISSVLNNLPQGAFTCFGGIGKEQMKMNILGFLFADGIRIGLEDNLYYQNKELTRNIDLLKRAHRLMNELQYDLFNPLDFNLAGFANRKKYQLASV